MDDISIKILDALFDLCDGENFVILDAQDLTARIPDYTFEPNELVEIFETLDADDLLDLRYADENEFCVAMKTKGRALIKQFRDRLQKMVATTEAANVSAPTDEVPPEGDSAAPAANPAVDPTVSVRAATPVKRVHEKSSFEYEQRTRSAGEPHPRPDERHEEEEDKPSKLPAEKKVLLFAAIGGAAGALIVNLIFLIVYFLWK
ncbi:MAG: hypothetical protein IJT69_02760 [Clostridia bacterium]|nr:hypothetical protein [Clostridia bacterium]